MRGLVEVTQSHDVILPGPWVCRYVRPVLDVSRSLFESSGGILLTVNGGTPWLSPPEDSCSAILPGISLSVDCETAARRREGWLYEFQPLPGRVAKIGNNAQV
jgi:hypothetical protein